MNERMMKWKEKRAHSHTDMDERDIYGVTTSVAVDSFDKGKKDKREKKEAFSFWYTAGNEIYTGQDPSIEIGH